MTKIIFRPVCNACGGVLYCDVGIIESPLEIPVSNKELWVAKSTEIEPRCCPHCGETFERIVMPTRLPYYTDIMDSHD